MSAITEDWETAMQVIFALTRKLGGEATVTLEDVMRDMGCELASRRRPDGGLDIRIVEPAQQ